MISVLSKLLIHNYQDTSKQEVRQAYGMLCGGVGIVLNIFLFLGKVFAGTISGSIAITADAFNNLSDAGSSIITLVGFKMAGQKPDSDHPFGHGRFEYIAGFTVSIIILIMAFELLKSSVEKILHPSPIATEPVIFIILIISICIKVYMFIYNKSISRKICSEAMDATAKDSISDSISTIVVLLTTLLAYFTNIQIDGYCGVLVAIFVCGTGLDAAKETISPLLGQPPQPEFVQKIEDIVAQYHDQGALAIHDLVVHNYGPGRVMLSVHVEVPASGDILELHDMIDLIEHRLARELNCSAVIHMDPVCVDDEKTTAIREKVKGIIDEMDGNVSFHDFRMVEGPTHTNLIFDVVIPYRYTMTDTEVVAYIQSKISDVDSSYFAVIEVEESYT